MKLTELFRGENYIADFGKTQSNTAVNAMINRQIRAMIPGQTIQGEVLSKSGSEVQIRLTDDMVLMARLEQSMNLEVGKSMLFEVKNNGRALMLSPLFTNVATDANVMKALDMASLPVNGTTVSLTRQLMEAGLPIDRQSLQQAYREVNQFMQAEVSDIVNLHKMQIPVNENSVNQMVSYRNLSHQLMNGMNQVFDAVPEMLSHMVQNGDAEGALQLYQQLTTLAGESMTEGTAPQGSVVQNPATFALTINGQNVIIQLSDTPGETGQQNLLVPEMTQNTGNAETVLGENMSQGNPVQTSPDTISISQDVLQVENTVKQTQTSMEGQVTNAQAEAGTATEATMNSTTSTVIKMTPEQLVSLIQEGKVSLEERKTLEPLLQQLKQQWTITPEEVADSEKVEQLYGRLNKQLKNMAQILESAGQTNTTTFKAVSNMSQNIDFMQQINQMYTYVQLPLRLQQGEAHGDLYVYTNKKNLAAKDGPISALLHLDMEHLGPVDVYVSMNDAKVNTKFYLQDDEMLDFIMGHMDILTERLQKRGYNCTFEMQVRNHEEEEQSSIQKLLQQENHIPLAEYAFDIRA